MKSKLLTLIFCLFTFSLFAVNQAGICSVCHKPLTQCKGHAAPTPTPVKCSQCGKTNCRTKNNHKVCITCGQYDFKCKFRLNHTCSQCGEKECKTMNKHGKCSICGEYDFRCKYNLTHPTCESCLRLIGANKDACQYEGHHPICNDCEQLIGSFASACPYNGKHEICKECNMPINGIKENSCPFEGRHLVQQNVTISCDAPNATLTIDGVPAGQLPITLELLQGKHTLSIKADGYADTLQDIFVDNNSKNFHISLARATTPIAGTTWRKAYRAYQMKTVGIVYTALITTSPIGIPLWIVGNKKCKQLEREGFDFNTFRVFKRKKK